MLSRKPKISHRYLKLGIQEFHRKSWFQQIKLQTTLLLFDGCTILTVSGAKAYEQTSAKEKSVINNHIFQNADKFV